MGLVSDLSSPEMWVRGMGSWAGPDEPKDLSSYPMGWRMRLRKNRRTRGV